MLEVFQIYAFGCIPENFVQVLSSLGINMVHSQNLEAYSLVEEKTD